MLPEHLVRYPTKAGRESLAARLGLTGGFHDDWEWVIADPQHFQEWLGVYQHDRLSDDERFSLVEMLVQCVEDSCRGYHPWGQAEKQVESLAQWQAIAAILRANPRLHASTIHYWSVFEADEPEERFQVSMSMRRVWAEVRAALD